MKKHLYSRLPKGFILTVDTRGELLLGINPFYIIIQFHKGEDYEEEISPISYLKPSLMKRLRKPIYIPTKFVTSVKNYGKIWTDSAFILTKIFLLDNQGTNNFLTWYRKGRILQYRELLDYIEGMRVKNIHRLFTGKPVEKEVFVQPNNLEENKKKMAEQLYSNLYQCGHLLRTNSIFPHKLIKKLNGIKKEIVSYREKEYKFWKGQQEELSKRIKKELAEILKQKPEITDAYDDFIYTLYDDLFKDMLESGNFKICKYKRCSNFFQRREGQNERYWRDQKYCNKKCENRARRHRYYEKHKEEEKKKSRESYREGKEYLKERQL